MTLSLGSAGCMVGEADIGGLEDEAGVLARQAPTWSVDDVEAAYETYAIGHRGMGANNGEDASRPVENTKLSIKTAFRAGVPAVEVDVQLTADGRVVMFHDDYLADYSCINAYPYADLIEVVPTIDKLKNGLSAALQSARGSDTPTGIVYVELKAPAPLCDPLDETEASYVSAVIDVIEAAGMSEQVVLTSFSPTLLVIARSMAPDIAVELAVSALQFLSAAEIEAVTGLPATPIEKYDYGFGLQWAEIGPVYRLPAYESPSQALGVAYYLGARSVSLDVLLLGGAEQSAPGSAAAIVAGAQSLGLRVSSYTATNDPEWFFLDSVGVDSITTDVVAHSSYQH